jgi:protein-S-isoprenylcysteine O-methyltransferase Ste14
MEFILKAIVSAVSVIVVAQYIWAVRAHFSSKTMPRGTVLISVVVLSTTLFFLALLWLGTQSWIVQILGLVIELAGLALFWAAIRASRAARLRLAFDEENPDSIVTEGPYRYLRHPFYTSYLIFWIGWAIAIWSVWTLVPLAALITIYAVAAKGEERKFSNTPMAEAYAAYKQQAGFFWPRIMGRANPN